MPEDDAALRATLTRIVLADLQAARSPLSPPAVAALRILSSAPATTPSGQAPARPAGCSLRRAGVAAGFGVGVAAVAGAVFLATGSDAPPPLPQAAPTAALPADRTPLPADGGSALPAAGTPVLPAPSATTAPSSGAGPVVREPASRAAATIPATTIRAAASAAAPAPARTPAAVPSPQPPAPTTAGPGPSADPTAAEPGAAEPTTPEPITPGPTSPEQTSPEQSTAEPTTPGPTTLGPEAAPSDAGPATEDPPGTPVSTDGTGPRCPDPRDRTGGAPGR